LKLLSENHGLIQFKQLGLTVCILQKTF
jgi:hypothetical protein